MKSVSARSIKTGKRTPTIRIAVFSLTVGAMVFVGSWAACADRYTPVTSKQLIAKAMDLDKESVSFTGESVTSIMVRGAYAWVNLYDGENTICVWIPAVLASRIKTVGDYKHQGDAVEIKGRFNRACRSHHGELDIHAEDLRIVKPGNAVKDPEDRYKWMSSIALFLMVAAVAWFFRSRL